ncbi:MAG: ECF-type sigma factor, partial [Rhodothermales bacterium]|nr:ECF-type sigma factor [Rhodothermales bacterium]
MAEPHEITRLLARAHEGDRDALARLIPIIYDELRALAHQQRRRSSSETLNTTALVHEAYEKLARSPSGFADRNHFFRVAARAMREVLVDHARKQRAAKRGGGVRPLPLDEARLVPPEQAGPLLALDEALTRLSTLDARQAEVVELRYFVGMTVPETAEIMGLSPATVKREW